MKRLARLAPLLVAAACTSQPLDTAPSVDLNQFQGKWYEIAHLPRPAEANCTGTVAKYTMQSNGQLSFVHECTLTDGTYHGSTALATVKNKADTAKLQVDFGGYVGDYWILEVAPDYHYAVVGHPSRDYLWILSRTPSLRQEEMDSLLESARAQSFDTTKLIYTPQAADPIGNPAPPYTATTGCSASPESRRGSGGNAMFGVAIAAVAILAARRRRRASASSA
ncbi:hypothetical protein BH09MYX1_BH09MYX1_31660 [soil metagenome]